MIADFLNLLLSDPEVSALVGDRITPGKLAQGGDYPAIVVSTAGGISGQTSAGRSGLVEARLQVSYYGESHLDAHTVSAAAIDLLDGYRGTSGATQFDSISRVGTRDFLDPALASPGDGLFRIDHDFIVWHHGRG